MADVEALCKRVIVIHNGRLLFDGDLSALVDQFSAYKTIGVTLRGNDCNWSQYGEVINRDGARVTLRVPKESTSQVTARILAEQAIDDLTVEDPPIEDVIEKVFSQQSVPAAGEGR
jgi:ABC-2 type transport system ATP-binding protein